MKPEQILLNPIGMASIANYKSITETSYIDAAGIHLQMLNFLILIA